MLTIPDNGVCTLTIFCKMFGGEYTCLSIESRGNAVTR